MGLLRVIKFIRKSPFITNTIVYTSLYVGAELSQQLINKKIKAKEGINQPLDVCALARYAVIGSCVNSPYLYCWYKWLDGRFPAKSLAIVRKKLILDQFLMTPPLYFVFYTAMSVMEGKEDILEEFKEKFLVTFMSSTVFWIPAQTINFVFVPPAFRIVYMGACSFLWANVLCYIKRS